MPAILKEVKGYMEFWGWTVGGGPHSVKVDEGGKIIAYHGDATWIKDVEEACDTIGRLAERAKGDK